MRVHHLLGVAVALHAAAALGAGDDPAVDPSDFYVFRSPSDDPDVGANDTITFVATYWPFEDPGAGPSLPRFASDVYYRILIDNDGDAKEDIVYQLAFETRYLDKSSILYNRGPITSPTDPNLLVQQVARLERLETKTNKRTEQRDLVVAPIYTGPASYPSVDGKGSDAAYEAVAAQAITKLTVKGGGRIFLGPRDDPFFADLGAIFDLLTIRGGPPGGEGKGGGVDYLAGYNVHAIAIQLPIAALGIDVAAARTHGKRSVIGAWTGAWRRKKITIGADGKRAGVGYQQVARVGLPLVDTMLVPVGARDAYNASAPKDDAKALAAILTDPELARRFKQSYNLAVPTRRSDLAKWFAFDAGVAPLDVPGLLPADLLRIDLSVPAAPLYPRTRLGLLAGDRAGFPNGRRLADDVVDITERIVAGVLCRKGTTCDVDAVTAPLGDAVDQNDRPWLPRFPYLATPHAGASGRPLHGKPAGRQ